MPGIISKKIVEAFLDEVSGGSAGSGSGGPGTEDGEPVEDTLEEFASDEGGLLTVAYGEHLVAGQLIAHKYSEGPPPSSRFVVALGDGEWDSAVNVWYAGDALTAQSDGSTPGYDFHRGTISTAIDDATQGVSNVLSAGLAYNTTANVAVLLPEQYSTEDRPDKLRGRYKCKRVYDYNADGVASSSKIYSVNPALVAADVIRRYYEVRYPNDLTTAYIKFRDRINWSSWYAWRNYCAATITWNDGTSSRSIARFECHIAFTGNIILADALDGICACAGTWWQDDGEQIYFKLPNDTAPVHHFHYGLRDGGGDQVRSNIEEGSFSLQPQDVRNVPNYFTAKFRNTDDTYLAEGAVGVRYDGQDDTEDLISKWGKNAVERQFPPMNYSQARRLLKRQARIEAENRTLCTLTGRGDSFHVLKGDFVTVTHPAANWNSQLCLVVDTSIEPAESAPDLVTFTLLKLDSYYLYSDDDHKPRQAALVSTTTTSTVTGLKYFFDANEMSYADGATVTALTDISGLGNHATQATSGNRGVYKMAISGFNGNPVVQFTAANSHFYTLPDILSSFTEGEVFIVLKLANDPPSGFGKDGLWQMDTDGLQASNVPYYSNGQVYDGWGSNSRKSTGKNPDTNLAGGAFLYNISSKASEWTMRINGAGSGNNYYQTTSNTVAFPTAPKIGGASGGFGSTYLDGWIAYIQIFNRVLTNSERDSKEAELGTRFGITIA